MGMKMILTDSGNKQKLPSSLTEENIDDLNESLDTIVQRGEGILSFVSDYRKLTKVPKPKLRAINIQDPIQSTITLLRPDLEKRHISLK